LKGKLIIFVLYGTGLCVTTENNNRVWKGNREQKRAWNRNWTIQKLFNFKAGKKSQTKNNQGDPRKEERIVQANKHTIKGAREFLPTVAKIT